MADIQIRKVQVEYAEAFRACLDEVAKEKKFLLLLEAPPTESIRDFLEENVKGNVPQFFAFSDDQIVGWCDVKPFSMPTINHRAEMGMGVRKAYRGKGIGRKLIEQAMYAARVRGIEKIDLEVFADNAPAIQLYKNLGFIEEGRIRSYPKIDTIYQDSVWMGKFLN